MRSIQYDFNVNQPIEQVWKLLTTDEGISSFFSPYHKIDFKVNGMFEIYFDIEAPKGEKGSEGMKILSIEEPYMISFTWNNPPKLETVRKQMTVVHISLEALNDETTLVHFMNSGYGKSKQWNEAYHYFIRAWGSIVLPRMQYALEVGAYDWNDPPNYARFDLNK